LTGAESERPAVAFPIPVSRTRSCRR
jgi:hypothetical protein